MSRPSVLCTWERHCAPVPLRGVRRSSPQKPSAAASDWLSEAAVPPPACPRCPAALTAALAALPAFLFPAPPGVGGGGLSRLPPDATAPALSPDTLSIASDCSIVSDGASLASDSTFSLRRRRGLGRRRASAPRAPAHPPRAPGPPGLRGRRRRGGRRRRRRRWLLLRGRGRGARRPAARARGWAGRGGGGGGGRHGERGAAGAGTGGALAPRVERRGRARGRQRQRRARPRTRAPRSGFGPRLVHMTAMACVFTRGCSSRLRQQQILAQQQRKPSVAAQLRPRKLQSQIAAVDSSATRGAAAAARMSCS